MFTLGGGEISWGSKKQTCITHSTMESEFIALAATGKEAEWLRDLLLEIPFILEHMSVVSMHCDSQATLARAYNGVYNGYTIDSQAKFTNSLIYHFQNKCTYNFVIITTTFGLKM